MKRRLAALAAGVLLVAGCGASSSPEEPIEGYYTEWLKLDDGRVIECLYSGNGVSCNWEDARRG